MKYIIIVLSIFIYVNSNPISKDGKNPMEGSFKL